MPPLGWSKPFSGTGKAAYLQTDNSNGDKPYLRVVDALDPAWNSTYAKYAKVGICEGMTNIDTWNTEAPYDPASPTKNWVGVDQERQLIMDGQNGTMQEPLHLITQGIRMTHLHQLVVIGLGL